VLRRSHVARQALNAEVEANFDEFSKRKKNAKKAKEVRLRPPPRRAGTLLGTDPVRQTTAVVKVDKDWQPSAFKILTRCAGRLGGRVRQPSIADGVIRSLLAFDNGDEASQRRWCDHVLTLVRTHTRLAR
jgi:hypothetical protein